MQEPIWVRDDVVALIHARQIAEHGGQDGIRDPALLESALARPRNAFAYAGDDLDLCDLAAAYAFGIARNHPFVDGNKRTAFVVCRTFLRINGEDFQATAAKKFAAFYAMAEGSMSEAELAAWIREHGSGIAPGHSGTE